ncbi:hypothetical protein ACH4ZX_33070 [Streptomyces sp. NPDC020490]|uniref:hypothetical protein n=1 Tax=Streptomyces sp. NPDC020490 TaxID=3365078 RepID=UPI00378E054E
MINKVTSTRGRFIRILAVALGLSALSSCGFTLSSDDGDASRGETSKKHRTIVGAENAGGLKRDRDHEMLKKVSVDPGKVTKDSTVVVTAYTGEQAADPILFVGEADIPESTAERREYLYGQLIPLLSQESAGKRPEAHAVDAGTLGGSVECMMVDPKRENSICGWADSHTTGVAVIPDMKLDEAGRLFASMRADIEK